MTSEFRATPLEEFYVDGSPCIRVGHGFDLKGWELDACYHLSGTAAIVCQDINGDKFQWRTFLSYVGPDGRLEYIKLSDTGRDSGDVRDCFADLLSVNGPSHIDGLMESAGLRTADGFISFAALEKVALDFTFGSRRCHQDYTATQRTWDENFVPMSVFKRPAHRKTLKVNVEPALPQ